MILKNWIELESSNVTSLKSKEFSEAEIYGIRYVHVWTFDMVDWIINSKPYIYCDNIEQELLECKEDILISVKMLEEIFYNPISWNNDKKIDEVKKIWDNFDYLMYFNILWELMGSIYWLVNKKNDNNFVIDVNLVKETFQLIYSIINKVLNEDLYITQARYWSESKQILAKLELMKNWEYEN